MRALITALICGATALSACASDQPTGAGTAEIPRVPATNVELDTLQESSAVDTIEDLAEVEPDATAVRTSSGSTNSPEPYGVVTLDGEMIDASRDRAIPYRVYAPTELGGDVPVVLVSHGGRGSSVGYTRGGHLGSTFAAGGFVAIHVGHLTSAIAQHNFDRPGDVTAVLDELEAGRLDLPNEFRGRPDLRRVGHVGHSWGAYTGHALGGADYGAAFTDDRIDAIAPISPQGAGQFGGFDNGPDDNTWASVEIPAYNLIGGDEVDGNVAGTIIETGWRLTPFERYPSIGDKFVTVIDGQGHSNMWNDGSRDVEAFIAGEILEFLDVYVAGGHAIDACDIGERATDAIAWTTDRISDPAGRLTDC